MPRRKHVSRGRYVRRRLSPNRRYLALRGAKARILATIAERPGELLSLSRLRERMGMGKTTFDKAVLELAEIGRVTLHHHDFPISLKPADRAKLVYDKEHNIYYVGVALRKWEG